MQRCQVAFRTLAAGAFKPSWASEMTNLTPPRATERQGAQEVPPERIRFAWTDSQTKHLTHAIGVYGDGNYYGLRHDPAGLPRLHVGRIDPQVRPVAAERPIKERVDALVDLGAQPADLALRDPGHPDCLDQLVDRTGRDALDIYPLDDGGEGLLGRSARLEERREVAGGAQLRDLDVDRAGAALSEAFPVAVAAALPLGGALAVGSGAQVLHFYVHHALHDVLDHFAYKIGVWPLSQRARTVQCFAWSSWCSPVLCSAW